MMAAHTHGEVYVLQEDMPNPQADRRSRHIVQAPVIPAGTHLRFTHIERVSRGTGEPVIISRFEVLEPASGRVYLAEYAEMCSALFDAILSAPKGLAQRDIPYFIARHEADARDILDVLLATGQITLDQIGRAAQAVEQQAIAERE